MWDSFIDIFPGLIAAIVIIIVGWIVGKVAGGLLRRGLRAVGLDLWIRRERLTGALFGVNLSSALGTLLKWYILVLFVTAAAGQIRIDPLVTFLDRVIPHLPAILGGILMVVVGLLIGEFIKKSVLGVAMPLREVVGNGLKYLVVFFTIVIALETAGFDVSILENAFILGFGALVITGAIIIGISFGLAFKEDARRILKDLRERRKETGKKSRRS